MYAKLFKKSRETKAFFTTSGHVPPLLCVRVEHGLIEPHIDIRVNERDWKRGVATGNASWVTT